MTEAMDNTSERVWCVMSLKLVKQPIVSVQRLHRTMFAVEPQHALNVLNETPTLPVESSGQNVAENNNKRQACHKRRETEAKIRFDVVFPKGW